MSTTRAAAPWLISLLGLLLGADMAEAIAGNVATRLTPIGDAIELEIPTDIGVQKEVIPLYQSGKIRYFSAGIGQVERAATYPPFPLKLIFTAGGKPFVTGVTVTLRNAKGGKVLTVPAAHITGPWLFIDLPEGMYEVTATLGGEVQVVKAIKVKPGKSLTQHVRWSEDRSPPLVAQPE